MKHFAHDPTAVNNRGFIRLSWLLAIERAKRKMRHRFKPLKAQLRVTRAPHHHTGKERE